MWFVVSGQFPHNSCITKDVTNRRSKLRRTGTSAPYERTADARLGLIVRLLMEHATVVVSGTKIAQEISGTRSEVWRLIQQLRCLGVDVAGHPAAGYQLKAVPDLLLPEILAPLLRGTIFDSHIHHFYKIDSTNTQAMAAAAEGAPEGSVFITEEQSAGRGRGGHAWESARSAGIYCSLILRPALPPSDVLLLSLAVGLAAGDALKQIDAKIRLDLKWPNDVLLHEKKVCGILTEMNAEATRVRYVVVGVGINVNQQSFSGQLENQATSLRMATGREWSRVELAAALLKSLDREYASFISKKDARESILRRFSEQSSWVGGKQIRVQENGSMLEGTTEGLDERGFLLLRTRQGLRTILSGTVRPL